MDQFTPFILTLAGGLSLTFIIWSIRSVMVLSREVAETKIDVVNLKLHVAENYVPNPDMAKIEANLEKVDNKVNSMLELLYRISARVGAEGAH